METLVSGPVILLRLQNKGKVVYLFGDVHYDLHEQYECNIDKDSIYIDQLFKQIFKKNKNVNFYLETSFNLVQHYKNQEYYTSPYIHKLRTLFSKNVNFSKHKIVPSKKYPNVRFHYFDIRIDSIKYNDLSKYSSKIRIYNIKQEYTTLLNLFQQSYNDIMNSKYIQKILNRKYDNKKIFKSIFSEIEDMYEYLMDKVKQRIGEADKIVKKFNHSSLTLPNLDIAKLEDETVTEFNDLHNSIINLFVIINDTYFLYRLNKSDDSLNYVYSGAYHSLNICFLLLRYFEFDISHSTTGYEFIKKTQCDMKQFIEYSKMIENNINLNLYSQCIDINNFPENLQ